MSTPAGRRVLPRMLGAAGLATLVGLVTLVRISAMKVAAGAGVHMHH